MWRKGQVVCVSIWESGCLMWHLGKVSAHVSSRTSSLYDVEVPVEKGSFRENREPDESYMWSGYIPFSKHSLAVLCARIASRTFLANFQADKVLCQRTVYKKIPLTQLCEPSLTALLTRLPRTFG